MQQSRDEFRQRSETYIGDEKAKTEKDVYGNLLRILDSKPSAFSSLLDVGCATGDFVRFIKKYKPDWQLEGVDIEDELLDVARSSASLKGVTFTKGDVRQLVAQQYDVVTLLGVLGIFDSFEDVLSNLVRATKPGGKVLVQALLNPDDIDVKVLYRDNLNGLDWMRGFNIFSRTSVQKWADSQNIACKFHDFHMRSELPKRPSLPHRAHTIDLANGDRRTTNGLCLLLPETILEIDVLENRDPKRHHHQADT